MMEIKVLGPGCVKCRGLDHRVRKAVRELGLNASVTKVENVMEIMKSGILKTPGLMVNGKLILSGELPTYAKIKELLIHLNEA